jgi:hypothetical protein
VPPPPLILLTNTADFLHVYITKEKVVKSKYTLIHLIRVILALNYLLTLFFIFSFLRVYLCVLRLEIRVQNTLHKNATQKLCSLLLASAQYI